MKRALTFLLGMGLILSMGACSEDPVSIGGSGGEPIGDDWHVWGLYDFTTVGGLEIAIGRANDETPQQVGYDIYADGKSRGSLLAEIRCWHGDYLPEDLNIDEGLLFRDYNGDGLEDIGAPMRSGDILWYIQSEGKFDFAEVEEASAESWKDWHDWGIYRFVTLKDGMTVALSAAGNPGYEVGFNVYADLGPERGALLGSIRWSDGDFSRGFFDLENCLQLEDHNGDGLVDIGVQTRQGDSLWYLRDESRHFAYAETEVGGVDLSLLAGRWKSDDKENPMYYEIDSRGRRYDFSGEDYAISSGLILPAGEEEGHPKYEMIDENGEAHDVFYLLSEKEIRFGAFDHPDESMVQIFHRVNE